MTAPEYRFVSRWKVLGTAAEVSDVLRDGAGLPRWWPSVYLSAEVLDPGDAAGVGSRVRLHTKGWLPYTLQWEFRVTESKHPHGFSLEAEGDLAGRGTWRFEPSGAWVDVTYDWRVRAEKPLLRLLSPIARPLLEANHRWAMRMGERSLELELARRRANGADRARIPPPPGPTTDSPLPLIAVGTLAGLAVFALVRASGRGRRRRSRW